MRVVPSWRARRYRALSVQAWKSPEPRRACPPCGAGAFSHVVDDHDGKIVSALELAQEGEQLGDIAGVVFIFAVKAHQGVEQQQAWLEVVEGVVESLAIGIEVES